MQTPFPPAPPGPFTALVAWSAVTCGLRPDGRAECWHGLPSALPDWSVPDEQWAQFALGEFDGCGVTVDGRGLCFGQYDNEGEWQVPDLEDL